MPCPGPATPPTNRVDPVWWICAFPCGCCRPRTPAGVVQLPPRLVVRAGLAPFWAIANQVLRVASGVLLTKNGYQDTPPEGKPAPVTLCQVAPPSIDS